MNELRFTDKGRTLHVAGMIFAIMYVAHALLALGQSPSKASLPSKDEPFQHYDVVSVKPASPEERGLSIGGTADSFTAKNVGIALLLENTYSLREEAIVGVPPSLNSKRFDIVAKLLDASPKALEGVTGEQRQKMLEALLEERFALKAHETTKVAQVYVLIQARDGARIKPSVSADRPADGMAAGSITVSNGHLKAHAIPISSLVGSLTGAVQHDVIDETKLPGLYDFDLTWDASQGGATGNAVEAGPSLFTALQEQLGLKLVPAKRPMPILIVDHVEMPSQD